MISKFIAALCLFFGFTFGTPTKQPPSNTYSKYPPSQVEKPNDGKGGGEKTVIIDDMKI